MLFKKPIDDFALRDLDGKLVRLSEQKGKTVAQLLVRLMRALQGLLTRYEASS